MNETTVDFSDIAIPGESATDVALERVWVIIPARNEEASIELVLKDLPPVGRVFVIDNGSTDKTAEVAENCGAIVVTERQAGYGRACLTGMAAVAADAEEIDPPRVIVFLDGDYSDYPQELMQLVEPIFFGQADFVLGSRLRGQRERGAMPPQSVYGNKLACGLMRLIWRGRYTDLGPFRAIDYRSLLSLGMSDENFGWTVEMQIKACVAKLRTIEIPVRYRRRVGVSKISGTVSGTFKAGYKILWTIARYTWSTKLRRAKPTALPTKTRRSP